MKLTENSTKYEESNKPFSLRELYEGNRGARILQRIILSLLILLLLGTPLPFGSVTPVWLFVIEIVCAVSVFFWIIQLIFFSNEEKLKIFQENHRTQKERLRKLPFFNRKPWLARILRVFTLGKWPRKNVAENVVLESLQDGNSQPLNFFSLFGYPIKKTGLEKPAIVFLALNIFQIIPMPDAWMRILSPSTRDFYQTAAGLANLPLKFFPSSVDSFLTFAKFLEYSAYFSIYLLVVNALPRWSYRRLLLFAILLSAVFQAGYGLYEYLSGHQHIFGYQKKYQREFATGTFINHNHFAAYLELAIPILLGIILVMLRSVKISGKKFIVKLARALDDHGSKAILLTAILFLLLVALIFSFSRSAIIFTFVASFILLFLFGRKEKPGIAFKYWISGIALLFVILVGTQAEPLVRGFTKIPGELTVEISRPAVWRSTYSIFLDFPVTGSGFGTFKQVFPAYRNFSTNAVYSQAHNDYVQLLAEGGIIMIFIFLAIGISFAQRWRQVLSGPFSSLRLLLISSFCSLLAIALHSFTDFSFQIPAIAVTTMILTGLCFAETDFERKGI